MSFSPDRLPEFYDREQMEQVLHLAIARQNDDELISRQQLEEIALEIGIDSESFQAAEKEWLVNQKVVQKQLAFQSHRQNKLQQKVFKYLLVNTFLISINLLTGGTLSWSLYILLFWGLILANTAWKTFQSQGEEYDRAFKNWERKTLLKRTMENVWSRLQKALSVVID
jgi:2TM domain